MARKWTNEQRAELSARQTGRHHPHAMPPMKESTKRKISVAHLGMKMSDAARAKMRLRNAGQGNPMFGRKHSSETIAKLRAASSGKRPSGETREKMALSHLGPKSHYWKGGVANEAYGNGFKKYLKTRVRKRDGYRCQICNVRENGKALDCHHIDYNKQNNAMANLVALCHPCHSLTSTHRDRWLQFFTIPATVFRG